MAALSWRKKSCDKFPSRASRLPKGPNISATFFNTFKLPRFRRLGELSDVEQGIFLYSHDSRSCGILVCTMLQLHHGNMFVLLWHCSWLFMVKRSCQCPRPPRYPPMLLTCAACRNSFIARLGPIQSKGRRFHKTDFKLDLTVTQNGIPCRNPSIALSCGRATNTDLYYLIMQYVYKFWAR